MIGFENRRGSFESFFNTSLVGLQGELDSQQIERLKKIRRAWNFYEGYHWEEMPEVDTPELTVNYCRAFVNKFVSFELGKAFSFITHPNVEGIKVSPDGRTLFEYLEDVWEDNNQYAFVQELGQMKSVTGEAWVQARFFRPDELDDPYGEYPNGRLRLLLLPTSTVFPEFDPHDRDNLLSVTVMYEYDKRVRTGILGRVSHKKAVYKQVWTKETCTVIDDGAEPVEYPNKYGVVPFILFRNVTIAGRTEGFSDLDDIIPLNVELNLKESNVSEILDYHAAPITIVYGAKVGNLEKGANKMWGGLAKDARVENLSLQGDLAASNSYISNLRSTMCEVGGIPESVLGGSQAISNTSGVALQYMNGPLIERTNIKRSLTSKGLKEVNSLILLIAEQEGLIVVPESISRKDFFTTEVNIPDTLPKDDLIELQKIQQELMLGLECRHGAMERLGKENIIEKIEEIDKERAEHPELFNTALQGAWYDNQINSGMTNGSTAIEEVRKEMTGQNGPQHTPQNL